MRLSPRVLLIAAALAACAASLPVERRDYILSRPHGWVEVTIADTAIPALPPEEGAAPARPSYCSVEVELDREPYFTGAVYPTGEQPPFSARSGLRFPAPIGVARLTLEYAGCDVASEEQRATVVEAEIQVEESVVTDVAFDGAGLVAGSARPDSAVTLERLYEALTGKPRPEP